MTRRQSHPLHPSLCRSIPTAYLWKFTAALRNNAISAASVLGWAIMLRAASTPSLKRQLTQLFSVWTPWQKNRLRERIGNRNRGVILCHPHIQPCRSERHVARSPLRTSLSRPFSLSCTASFCLQRSADTESVDLHDLSIAMMFPLP